MLKWLLLVPNIVWQLLEMGICMDGVGDDMETWDWETQMIA
jgi:hypothetical protein